MENISRRVIAVRSSDNQVYVGWRLLGTDSPHLAFNLYRSAAGAPPAKLNSAPLTTTTDFVDSTADPTVANTYFVRPLLHGVELAPAGSYTLQPNTPVQQYVSVPLQIPPGGTNACGGSYTYSANDGSVGDLDGDGEYEIVLKWDPSDSRDSASTGCFGPVILDAYKLDGTRLWRINLGPNIRAGAHYTQFMVYDLDGDGKSEIVMKTADGSIDGLGHPIGDPSKNWVDTNPASPTYGKIVTGPEYLTVFSGPTGAALATTNYIPSRDPLNGWGGNGGNCNNDSSANRADRFLAAVAYLDGKHPSVVMCRGYYGRTVLAAWDWRNGELTSRWVFDTVNAANPFSGQGNHNLAVADVDGDGKDEIVYGSMVVDDNGTGLFSTGLRHGDAVHVSRFDPNNPDLLVYGVHENEAGPTAPASCFSPGTALYNARTGEILWSTDPKTDVGRGMAAVLNPNFTGAQFWGGSNPGGLLNIDGQRISNAPTSDNFAVWWDADLLRELEDHTSITKWDYINSVETPLFAPDGVASNNGTKANPVLTADLFGDWREEVVWRTTDSSALRIYTTTIPATNRMYTLMDDPQYRLAIAWQNVGYNQPPFPSFYIGPGMQPPPLPNIVTRRSAGVALLSAIVRKSGPPDARNWTIGVLNLGLHIAESTRIHGFTLTQTAGAACTPVTPKPSAFPLVVGDLNPGGVGSVNIPIDFSGCSADARFSVVAALSANGGPAASLERQHESR